MEVERVIAEAKQGARRRRNALLHGRRMAQSKAARHGAVVAMVKGVKALGMETCMTLGMLSDGDSRETARRRSRLLQPQHRYVGAYYEQDHHDTHLCRASRDAGERA